jgi:hypothetical protein
MSIAGKRKQELQGILDGIEARFGGTPVVAALFREITYDDLLAMNCVADALASACSSFVAWGPLTADGNTLAGRNLDWNLISTLFGQELIMVQAPDPAGPALGWVSITWPGLIGCYTGMNSEGVTVSVHDAPAGRALEGKGFIPRTFALRDAIEAAKAASAIDDIKRVLRARAVTVGNNVPVAMPFAGKAPPAVVFEYDGNVAQSDGVTVRLPDGSGYQVCTNHYRSRAQPTPCSRYDSLSERLASASKQRKPLKIEDAWSMLEAVAFTGQGMRAKITFTGVVFEPNKRKMHVAFATPGTPAPFGKRVTLDVVKLLREAGGR